ncbi:MAG: competence/damage-inducible protein A [Planctomycetaceae bacterium]
MRAEVVAVGTELLLGQIDNTNARWISERLAAAGVDVLHHTVVGDNLRRIVDALHLAATRADVVLVTGGLGPTEDDLTRDALAMVMDAPLERSADLEAWLRERFAGISSRPMPANNLRQADVPKGARPIPNDRGSAPGLVAELPTGAVVYAVPGVPGEMVAMFEQTVLPELRARTGAVLVSRVLRLTGMGESAVAEVLHDLFEASANPSVAYLAGTGEVKVRLTAKAATAEEAGRLLGPLAEEVRGRLGDVVFTTEDETLEEVVLRLLRERGLRLACAESLTGGAVSARLTRPPGASASFLGGAVVYAAEEKRRVLGVSRETIEGPGVVSEACARELAAGARRLFEADVALALTGAAGPEPHGGAEPGTVWIALEAADVAHARGLRLPGERERVRGWAAQAGLDLVRRYLDGSALPVSDAVI